MNRSKWSEIISELEKTIKCYERVNRIISLGYGDKLRGLAVDNLPRGNILDAGVGPGYLSLKILSTRKDVYVIGLDASLEMALKSLDNLSKYLDRYDVVVSTFEYAPFRDSSIDAIYSSYAIRDAIDHLKAFKELSRKIKEGGYFIDIDIGKPDNRVMRLILIIYIKYIVPVIAGLIYGRFDNPWRRLIDTIYRVPTNSKILSICRMLFKEVKYSGYAFSTLYVIRCRK